jgi:hypothetical protein
MEIELAPVCPADPGHQRVCLSTGCSSFPRKDEKHGKFALFAHFGVIQISNAYEIRMYVQF